MAPPDEASRARKADADLAESRAETDAAHRESDLDTAAVGRVIEEFTAQAEAIANETRIVNQNLVDSLAAEVKVFKRRNKVLVGFAATIASCCLVLVSGMGFLLWRSIYQTGPAIQATSHAVTQTVDSKNETIDDQKIVINQAVAYITQMSDQITELGGTPPRVILDPDKAEGQ